MLFRLVRDHKDVYIKLLGRCEERLYQKYKKIIAAYQINKNIYFPNKYFSQKELVKESKDCLAAVALYAVDKNSYVYYADPGKVKLYTELGLPIVITKSSEISQYISKFSSGEIVVQQSESVYKAVRKIANSYSSYINGIKKFSNYFYYETYYRDRFAFLENKNDGVKR